MKMKKQLKKAVNGCVGVFSSVLSFLQVLTKKAWIFAGHFYKHLSSSLQNIITQIIRIFSSKRTIRRRFNPFPRFNSVKFEISVIYTLILGVILLTFSSVFYFVTSQTLYDELDNELEIKAKEIHRNISSYLEVKGQEQQTLEYAVEQTIAREDKTLRRWWFTGFERSWFKRLDEQDLSEDFVNFVFLDEPVHINSKNLQDELLSKFLDNTELSQENQKFWNLDLNDKSIRVINYSFPDQQNPTHIIQVGISKGPVIHLLNQWMAAVLMSIPIILLITGFIGRLLASRILKPLDRIIDTATKISYENLNLKVEPRLHYKEMNHLIRTFNSMLSRLENSFQHIDEFNMHVAHELKTPLTIIRCEAELAHLVAKTKESKQSSKVIIDEIDKVLRTVEDLLFLGRTCYQTDSFNFEDVNLNEFLREIADQFKSGFAKNGIQFSLAEISSDITLRADMLHLRRLFFNLLDNAIKYTPQGGSVRVGVSTIKDKVHISLSDTGIGISDNHLTKVFDQFFREESDVKGVGLGLSISLAIAKAHNGEITVQSQASKGTTFNVVLPFTRKPELALL